MKPNAKRIPVAGPWITQKEIKYVADAAAHAWYENANKYHERFTSTFAAYVGRKYAIALPSCTSAIHLALLSLGIGRGDEVIVPDITWIASAAPIHYVGASPVFADIDPKTWCLSAKSFEACITRKTKAVIPVDLYGNMPDMDAIRAIAKRRGIAVIEDAAEALGSEYRKRKAGSFGEASVFSFHGSKILTTGEGGMLVTDREDLYKRALFLADHGRKPHDRMFQNSEVAYKYKMSSLQAALGLAQLERAEELIGRKRQLFKRYQKELTGIQGITLNAEPAHVKNTYWMVTILVDPKLKLRKEKLMRLLFEEGIDSRPFFSPLSSLPAYARSPEAKKARVRNRNAYRLSPYGVNLPSALSITHEQVRFIAKKLKAILKGR